MGSNATNIFHNYAALYNNTCSRDHIRNPRTNRCVLLRTDLGACIQATSRALAQGTPPGATCSKASEYDFHSGACVSDKPRVLAIRHMKRLHAYLQKQRNTPAGMPAGLPYNNLRAQHNNYNNYNNRNQMMLNYNEALMQARRDLEVCTKDLQAARAQMAQMTAMMMNNTR